MADDLIHRLAPELISEDVLTGMERDGWTPTQVRDLIKRYRELRSEVAALRGRRPGFSGRALSALCHLRAACDTSSNTATVSVLSLSTVLQEMGDGCVGELDRMGVRQLAFDLVETELREFSIAEGHLYPEQGAAITQRRPVGSLTTESSQSILGAVEALRRSRHE